MKIGRDLNPSENICSKSVDRKLKPRFLNSENELEEIKGENRRISYDPQISPSQKGTLKPLANYMESKALKTEIKKRSSD